jgi:hypothetical protein
MNNILKEYPISEATPSQRGEFHAVMLLATKSKLYNMATVLERELSQTRAVARLEEINFQKKMDGLNERIEVL